MSYFAVAEAWKELSPEDKSNYLVITSTLHTVASIYNDPPAIPYAQLVSDQHSTFTQFEIYVRAFDEELANVFNRDLKSDDPAAM